MTAAIPLMLACAGILAWIYRLLAHDSSRAPLPRHAGQTRPVYPRRGPDEGSATAAPGGTAPVHSGAPAGHGAVPLPLAVETPALYNTGALPRISQEAADELWWSL